MTATQRIGIIGAPTEAGASQRGTAMGPAALRTADLIETLRALGHDVTDFGDAAQAPPPAGAMPDAGQAAGWARALSRHMREIAGDGRIPIVLGGDHSISLGSVAGMATIAAGRGRELFLLWLDAAGSSVPYWPMCFYTLALTSGWRFIIEENRSSVMQMIL
jgi:arginase